jgi:hypothetical protein
MGREDDRVALLDADLVVRPRARRPRTADGSPCEPVTMMTTLPGGILTAWPRSMIKSSGNIQIPHLASDLDVFTHRPPGDRHLAIKFGATLAAICTRDISEAKVAMRMRPRAWRKTSSKPFGRFVSDSVQPARSALVLSASRASTPRCENSASLAKSGGQLSIGV